jgi:hypothetical protein
MGCDLMTNQIKGEECIAKRTRMRLIRIIFLAVWLLFLLPFVSAGNWLPQSIGSLLLVNSQSGEEAREEINKLHGKQISFRNGYVGSYEGQDKKGKIWVSEYNTVKGATQAVGQMAKGIKGSKQGNFWHYQEMLIEGVPVHFVLGMGQAHYFFQKNLGVYWLAVDPPIAKPTIRDLIRKIP